MVESSRRNAKNKSVALISQNNAFVIPISSTEVDLRGWQSSHVHVRTADFCIPKTLCGELSPVSTQLRINSKMFVSEDTVPLGLFLVAFPPPPVTFPATRLS
jgi:hypothetical protein